MDNGQRDRDRSRRGDRPSRFSDVVTRDRSPTDDKNETKRLYISNIPYETRWSDLKDLFKEKLGVTAYVELFNDENGKPRGCGIVEFKSAETARRAVEVMNRSEINGRKLVLKEEPSVDRRNFNKPKRPQGREEKDNYDRSYDRSENWTGPTEIDNGEKFSTYGLSLQFLDSIGVQPPLAKKVFVANLDYKVDQPKIKEIFKLAGKVRNIDLSVDKDGKSRGFAVVEFDHPVEAVQAISMFDRQMLYDRRMTVRMDRAHVDKPIEMRLPEGLKSVGVGLGPNGEPLRDVARNLPSNQPQQNNTLGVQNAAIGSGILGGGVQGATAVGLNGLGATGLGATNALGSTALGLQALGLTGLGTLQNQLLQSGLTGDLAGNLASALSAQQQLNLGQATGNLGVSNLGVGNLGVGGLGVSTDLARNSSMNMNNMNSNSFSGGSQSNMDRIPGAGYGRPTPSGTGMTGNSNRSLSSNTGGSYGGRSEIAPVDDRSRPTSDMVVVSNLPSTVTWQILREKFSECGEVKFAEITSNDTALVRFHKQWDAERAIKLFDRTRIDGRTIEVRYF